MAKTPRTRPATGKGRSPRTIPTTSFAYPMNEPTANRTGGRIGGKPSTQTGGGRGPTLGQKRSG